MKEVTNAININSNNNAEKLSQTLSTSKIISSKVPLGCNWLCSWAQSIIRTSRKNTLLFIRRLLLAYCKEPAILKIVFFR